MKKTNNHLKHKAGHVSTHKSIQRVVSMMLIGVLVTGLAPSVFAEEVAGNKDETVYIQLESNGRIEKATVVNAFDNTKGQIVDYGTYTNLVNLSTESAPVVEGDEVAFDLKDGEEGRFYYQGDIVNPVNPWVIDIFYTLDGKTVNADALAGATGHLMMEIRVKKNPLSKVAFADLYTLQLTATLNSEVATDVTAEGASIVTVGSNKQIVMMVLPKQEKVYTIEADIQAFKMDSITAAGTLANFDIDIDTDAIAEGIDKLVAGSNELVAGMGQFGDGLDQTKEAVTAFDVNLAKLDKSSEALIAGSTGIAGGLVALDQNGSALNAGVAKLIEQLNQASQSDEQVTMLATQMLQNPDPSVQALAKAVLGQLELKGGTQLALASFQSGLSEYTAGVTTLSESQKALNDGLLQYTGGVSDLSSAFGRFTKAFAELPTQFERLLEGQTSLNEGVVSANEQLTSMLESLPFPSDEDLSAVNSFVSEKNTPDSVQFVMKTPAIDFEVVKDIIPVKVIEKTFIERLMDLFK